MAKRSWGCLFDKNQAHKSRFLMMTEKQTSTASLPPHVDLRPLFPPITTQSYNNCTSEALSAAYEFAVITKLGKQGFIPLSRLFLYFQERLIEGSTSQDEGAQIHSGVLALMTAGICDEKIWPYKEPSSAGDISATTTRPSSGAYTEALNHKVNNAMLVEQKLETMKGILAAGHPIVVGFVVYPSIESQAVEHSGVVPMPSASELNGQPLGGHAIVLVGYDETSGNFTFRNSWGTGWGDKGYGYMPFSYVLNPDLCQDAWVVSSVVEGSNPPAPVPVPPPSPVPVPVPVPQPQPQPPTPSQSTECCLTCDPKVCCCARTRGKKLPTTELRETLEILTKVLQKLS